MADKDNEKTGGSMRLPPIHNTRSAAQWEIISENVDFAGRTVMDLGCGYGDIMARCERAGAVGVVGIDHDLDITLAANKRFLDAGVGAHAMRWPLQDVNRFPAYDISICFSVLPYLSSPSEVLKWMRNNSAIALIEAQYRGDGPGDNWHISDDAGMKHMLRYHWPYVKRIGATRVFDRGTTRTIWLCTVE